MSDPTNLHEDELALAERLRATFDAEAATLATRRQAGGAPPESALGSLRSHQGPSRRGWQRSIIPIAAALIVLVGLLGVTRLAQRQGNDSEPEKETASDAIAPEQTDFAAAATDENQAEGAGQEDATLGAIPMPDESVAAGSAMPTVAPAQPVPNFEEGSAEQGPTVSTAVELCVTGIVAPDTLNVRAEPTIEGTLLGELSAGQCGIQQLEQAANGWTLVRVHDASVAQNDGWVSARYLAARTGPTIPPSAPEYCVSGIVAPDTLTLRTGPSIDAAAVATLKADRCGLAYLASSSAGWLPVQVQGPDESLYVGYVSERFVVPATSGEQRPFQPNLIDPSWCAVSTQSPGGVPLRIGPSPDSLVLAHLAPTECGVFPSGDTDPTGEWSRVSVATINRGGWVPTNALRTTERFVEFGEAIEMTSVRFDLRVEVDNTAPLNPAHFRLLTRDGKTIGTLGADGVIELPRDLDLQTLTLVGYLTDKYCVRFGRPAGPSSGGYEVVVSPELCV